VDQVIEAIVAGAQDGKIFVSDLGARHPHPTARRTTRRSDGPPARRYDRSLHSRDC